MQMNHLTCEGCLGLCSQDKMPLSKDKDVRRSHTFARVIAEVPLCLRGLTSQGLAVNSMQWGAWGGAGMASNPTLRAWLEKVGMGCIHPPSGLHALASVLCRFRFAGAPIETSIIIMQLEIAGKIC